MQNKTLLRQTLLNKRKSLSKEAIESNSIAVTEKFISLPLFQQSQHIAAYWPLPGEIKTELIIKACWQQKKCCYLPKITPHFQMQYCSYSETTPLKRNSLGMEEPENSPVFDSTLLDLVLVPLVGFDSGGHRLGFGSGYYDRHFEFVQRSQAGNPVLIGLAHGLQEVPSLVPASWDVNLDLVITESAVIFVNILC